MKLPKSEDRLLEEMVSGEQYERQIKVSEKALKEIEEAAKTDRARLEAEREPREKELAQFEAERATAVAAIPEDLLDHYNRIARKHGGTALAEVQSEMCGACGCAFGLTCFRKCAGTGTRNSITAKLAREFCITSSRRHLLRRRPRLIPRRRIRLSKVIEVSSKPEPQENRAAMTCYIR